MTRQLLYRMTAITVFHLFGNNLRCTGLAFNMYLFRTEVQTVIVLILHRNIYTRFTELQLLIGIQNINLHTFLERLMHIRINTLLFVGDAQILQRLAYSRLAAFVFYRFIATDNSKGLAAQYLNHTAVLYPFGILQLPAIALLQDNAGLLQNFARLYCISTHFLGLTIIKNSHLL